MYILECWWYGGIGSIGGIRGIRGNERGTQYDAA